MSPAAAHIDDSLLDFAYGELSAQDAQAVEAHLKDCARCTAAYADIRGVRVAMKSLPVEPAPEVGLESLLAYAGQAARRAEAGPKKPRSFWVMLVAPLAAVTAAGVIGLVAYQTNRSVDLAGMVAAEEKAAKNAPSPKGLDSESYAEAAKEKKDKGAAQGQADTALAEQSPASKVAVAQKAAEQAGPLAEPQWGGRADAPSGTAAGPARSSVTVSDRSTQRRGLAKSELADSAPRPPSEYAPAPAAPPPPAEPANEPEASVAVAAAERPSLGLRGTASGGSLSSSSAPQLGRRLEEQRADDRDDDQKVRAQAVTESLEASRRASRAQDSQGEVRHALQVLQAGADGYARIEALKRLCDAFRRLGKEDQGERYCQELLARYPSSGAAKLEQQRRAALRPSARKKANAAPATVDESERKATEQQAPRPSQAK